MEKERIKMAENPHLNINLSFRGLSKVPKEIISYEDLQNFLNVYRIAATEKECEYLINLNSTTRNEMTFERYIDL